MSLSIDQQLFQNVERSRRILITAHPEASLDGAAAALAFKEAVRNLGKEAEVVIPNPRQKNTLSFLPGANEIKNSLDKLQKFVISLDVSKAKPEDLSYDVRDGKLHIFLTPKSGAWTQGDLTSSSLAYRYDLIITVDSPDLTTFGETYHRHINFWRQTPIANIDHTPENEHYGQINLVDVTAAAASEIVYDLLTKASKPLLSPEVATCLLTGLITKTKSFKKENVTPKTLEVASRLLSSGAKREEIISRLYRTQTIPTLRLWGRALSKLKKDESCGLVWTLLTKDDFINSGAGEEALYGVVDELILNSPGAETVVLLYEQSAGGICIAAQTMKKDATKIFQGIGAATSLGPRHARFCLTDKNLLEAERHVVEMIKRSSQNSLS